MDEITFIKALAQQINSWKELGKQTLPENHPALTSLASTETLLSYMLQTVAPTAPTAPAPEANRTAPNQAIFNPHAINEDDYEDYTPAGFASNEAYQDFLASQVSVLGDNIPDSMAGTLVDEQGNETEVGDFASSLDNLRTIIENAENEVDFDEETGDVYEERYTPIEVENLITVEYTRLDGRELTVNHVNAILAHPVSKGLERFGDIEQVDVRNDPDNPSIKLVDFIVDSEDLTLLKGMAIDAMQYRGVQIFPGLGRVQAVGKVEIDAI